MKGGVRLRGVAVLLLALAMASRQQAVGSAYRGNGDMESRPLHSRD
jgi:hypothetical protein